MATSNNTFFAEILIFVLILIYKRNISESILIFTPMIFGLIWMLGFMGWQDILLSITTIGVSAMILGLEISSIMSGAVSMIMGVGIDFGIQVVNRFAQEIKQKETEEAMKITQNNTLPQMVATTIAALIRFRAMSLGHLTILNDLSTMMSLGILFCFLAAATIIPPILVLNEKLVHKNPTQNKSKKKN